jgi:hypothetical protein
MANKMILQSYILKLQCLSVRLSVCVGSAWKILPITVRSLWSVLGGGAQAGKDRAGGSLTGALCTGFTLVVLRVNIPHVHCHMANVSK